MLAEAIFKRILGKLGPAWEHWRVESAGTWATPGLPPLPGTIKAAKKMALDIEEHRSRKITGEMLDMFDLVSQGSPQS